MPAIRPSRQPLQVQHAPNFNSREVIVLSSDDEDIPPAVKKSTKTATARGKARAKQSSAADRIEIFSEEESTSVPLRKRGSLSSASSLASASSYPAWTQLHKQLEELQRENEKLKAQVASAAFAADTYASGSLKATEKSSPSHAVLTQHKKFLAELEDNTSCEICIAPMWSPYVLTCGHSFCKACLIDWFGTALAQHLQTFPDYNPHPPALQQYMITLTRQNFPPQQRRAIERELRSMYDSIQRPAYTCPKCRDPVERAPIDCYLLKNVTQAVAKHSGEGGAEAASANPQEGVWDGFFPPVPKFSGS